MTQLFGTNGIRGIVNREMTSALALHAGMAWGSLLKIETERPVILIGTDARISNDMLKTAMSSGFLSVGCDVVDVGLVPTPSLQYAVKTREYDGGVIITASHNPPEFNGIKGVDHEGVELYKQMEEAIEQRYFTKDFEPVTWDQVGHYFRWEDAVVHHIQGVLNLVDAKLIQKQHFHVVLDCGHGAGSVMAPHLLQKLGCTVTEVFCSPDGRFPGRHSEPIPEHLTQLRKTVSQENNVVFGIAQDGDADRAIFIDEQGTFIPGDQSLTLLGKQEVQIKKGGICVTPVTTSTSFEETITKHGGKVITCKVGSPAVARVMLRHHAILGGEENGGLIYPQLQHCRDSFITIAKMLELLAKEQRPLSTLIKELPRYHVFKIKLPCPNHKKQHVMESFVEAIKKDTDILRIDETDGVKLFVHNGWVIIRPSGTEPIFRVFAETKDAQQSKTLAIHYKVALEDHM